MDHKGRHELFSLRAAANSSAIRNTCVAEQKRATGRLSEPWIRKLLRESGSLAETNFDATHQRLSRCLRLFLPASPLWTRPGCSKKPGVGKSSHDGWYAKLQSKQGPFSCHRPSGHKEASRRPVTSVSSCL